MSLSNITKPNNKKIYCGELAQIVSGEPNPVDITFTKLTDTERAAIQYKPPRNASPKANIVGTFRVYRIGNVVTVSIPEIDTAGADGYNVTTPFVFDALPTRFRPSTTNRGFTYCYSLTANTGANSRVSVASHGNITDAGVINLYPQGDVAGLLDWNAAPNDQTNIKIRDFSFSFVV